MKKFDSVKEFINYLIDNQGEELKDAYGRKWRYENYSFYFKDIDSDWQKNDIDCLHLFGTVTNPKKYKHEKII